MPYSIKERFELTLGNIEFQGQAYWDDLEVLEHLIALMINGKSLEDPFQFVDEHTKVIEEHLNKIK